MRIKMLNNWASDTTHYYFLLVTLPEHQLHLPTYSRKDAARATHIHAAFLSSLRALDIPWCSKHAMALSEMDGLHDLATLAIYGSAEWKTKEADKLEAALARFRRHSVHCGVTQRFLGVKNNAAAWEALSAWIAELVEAGRAQAR